MDSVYQYLLAIYEHGSFTGAADACFVSQPALSIAIKKMEEDIGQPLINRKSRPIQLTDAGNLLIQHILRLQVMEQNIQSELQDLKHSDVGSISVGATQYVSAYVLPRYLVKFSEDFPRVELHITEVSSANLANLLESNNIDMIFTVKDFCEQEFVSNYGFIDNLFIAIPDCFHDRSLLKEYALRRSDIVSSSFDILPALPTLHHLADVPFVFLQPGNNLLDRSQMLFELHGLVPKVKMAVQQLTTAHHLCRAGFAATITTDQLISQIEDFNRVTYYKLDNPLMKRIFKIVRKKDRHLTNVMTEFLKRF